ncbi:uncharacterized protein LOC130890749 [Diorhabda carinulata]|uniref:uncharacterized protein LOC130890749 n=1 Tax=Diorhabda carinulata TaxID=1163345 RepID=UPI0025A13A02|nr:uncharacterized protein LOC130890749 [Diorhabda carinulata]
MADPTQQNEARSDNYCKDRYFHSSNRPYRGRGRGRGRDYRVDNVERALSELGVRDLREHLDRKHQNEQSKSGPPSDPSYNYLKDPLRENEDNSANVQSSSLLRSHSYRGRGRSRYEEDTFIQNPMNIKVELITSTGQRSCTLNEGSKLADIKHIPDYEHPQRGGFVRSRSSRGRGRGRFNNDPSDEGERIRSKSSERRRNSEARNHSRSKSVENKGRNRETTTNNSEYNPKSTSETNDYQGRGNVKTSSEIIPENVDYRGRGRISSYTSEFLPHNQKSRGSFDSNTRGRFRSRGRRWGGRRGRGNQRPTKSDIVQPANTDVTTEENWEDEENTDGPCETNTEIEDVENNDEETNPPVSYSEDISIVVNTTNEGNIKKRTVRFNLNENEDEKNGNSVQEKDEDKPCEDASSVQ